MRTRLLAFSLVALVLLQLPLAWPAPPERRPAGCSAGGSICPVRCPASRRGMTSSRFRRRLSRLCAASRWVDCGLGRRSLPPTAATCRQGTSSRSSPAGKCTAWDCGPTARIVAWGDDGSGQVSDTPAGDDFVAIAAGGFHGLALRADGSIVAWGDDGYGQVSDTPAGDDFVAVAGGAYWSLALRADGSIVAWGDDGEGQVSDAPAGDDFVAISAHACGYHGLALRQDGSIAAWGRNWAGGTAPAGNDFTAISAGGEHNLALRTDGSIVAWGDDSRGQVSDTPAGGGFLAVSAGGWHSLAIGPRPPDGFGKQAPPDGAGPCLRPRSCRGRRLRGQPLTSTAWTPPTTTPATALGKVRLRRRVWR